MASFSFGLSSLSSLSGVSAAAVFEAESTGGCPLLIEVLEPLFLMISLGLLGMFSLLSPLLSLGPGRRVDTIINLSDHVYSKSDAKKSSVPYLMRTCDLLEWIASPPINLKFTTGISHVFCT